MELEEGRVGKARVVLVRRRARRWMMGCIFNGWRGVRVLVDGFSVRVWLFEFDETVLRAAHVCVWHLIEIN